MLVLTRCLGEKIFINGKEIEVTILNVRGTQVRIGITAPKDIQIMREEIFDKYHPDLEAV
jgi:carbon storage regulator